MRWYLFWTDLNHATKRVFRFDFAKYAIIVGEEALFIFQRVSFKILLPEVVGTG